MQKNFISALLMATITGTFGCSMRDRTEAHSVSVQLPKVWKNSSSMNVLNNNSSNFFYSAPTGLGSFNCYALNVTGPGIQADPRADCTDPASGMGLLAGFVPVSSGAIEAMVPAGAERKVQLIGIQSDIGCALMDGATKEQFQSTVHLMGDPYVLGTTTTDIFDDTAVTIYAAFDPTAKAFQSCGGGGGGNQLRIQVTAGDPKIQTGNCTRSGIFANTSDPNLLTGITVIPQVTAEPSAGAINYYDDQNCTVPATAKAFQPGSNFVNYFVKTSLASGSFSVQVNATGASTWTKPVENFTIAAERVQYDNYTIQNRATNECTSVMVQNYTQPEPPYPSPTPMYNGTLGTIEVEVHKEGNTNTASTLQVFASNDNVCSTPLVPTAVSGSSQFYTISGFAAAYGTIFLKNANAEKVFLGVKKISSPAQPGGMSLNYFPFSMSTLSPQASVPAGGGSFPIYFNSPNYANGITEVRVGGVSCGSFASSYSPSINCNSIPAFASGSSKPISVIYNGTEYFVGQNVNYGFPPVLSLAPVTAYIGIPFNYSIPFSATVGPNFNPPSCTPGPISSTGLSINSNCTITGTPTLTTVLSNSVSIYLYDSFGSDTKTISTFTIEGPPSFMYPSDPYGSVCNGGGSFCNLVVPGTYMPTSTVNLVPMMSNTTNMSCSAAGLPIGLSINPASCAITGMPQGTPLGTTYPVVITLNKPPFAPVTTNISIKW